MISTKNNKKNLRSLFRRVINKQDDIDEFDIDEDVLVTDDYSESTGVKYMNSYIRLINPLRYIISQKELKDLYECQSLNIVNILYLIITIITVFLSDSNVTTFKSIVITFILYLLYSIVLSWINKLNTRIVSIINILIVVMIYYIALSLILLLVIHNNIVFSVFFAVLTSIPFITLNKYFNSVISEHNAIILLIALVVGFFITVFNVAVGIKTYQRMTGIDISTIYTDRDASLGVYKTKVLDDSELNRNYQNIFEGNSTYGNINKDGVLTDRLPSTSENTGRSDNR